MTNLKQVNFTIAKIFIQNLCCLELKMFLDSFVVEIMIRFVVFSSRIFLFFILNKLDQIFIAAMS